MKGKQHKVRKNRDNRSVTQKDELIEGQKITREIDTGH